MTAPALATFHFMQIEQVIGGVNGNASVQAIQLRMRANGQGHVDLARLIVRDRNGANPIVLIDFSTDMAHENIGDRVLIASANFASYSNPSVQPDFVLTNVIPESYLAAGSLTFENDKGTLVVWRLSWGGASYLGSTTGAMTNDDDGDFGPAWSGALSAASIESLLFTGAAADLSTSNANDYVRNSATVTLTNNAGATFTVTSLNCPNDPDQDADGDGVCGDVDNCPAVANADQADGDGDGVGDACDGCPEDANKNAPGTCGCGSPDLDSDGDGLLDCIDNCPDVANAGQGDADGDGAGDACDGCPDDPDKESPGVCGCGVDDADSDGDGVADCVDNCPATSNANQADADGDGVGDACDGCPQNPDLTEPVGGSCSGTSSGNDNDDDTGSNNNDNDAESGDNDNDDGPGVNDNAGNSGGSNDNDAGGSNDNSASSGGGPGSGGTRPCGLGMISMLPLLIVGRYGPRRARR